MLITRFKVDFKIKISIKTRKIYSYLCRNVERVYIIYLFIKIVQAEPFNNSTYYIHNIYNKKTEIDLYTIIFII